jgi:predicted ATP-binding protein involved in virulence
MRIVVPTSETADGRHALIQDPEQALGVELEGQGAVRVRLRYELELLTDSSIAEERFLSAVATTPTVGTRDEDHFMSVAFADSAIRGYLHRYDDETSGEPSEADLAALRLLLDAVARRLPVRRQTFLLHIDRLSLSDFRGFEAATFRFDGALSVLFGINGAGKSSVLDAIAIAVSAQLGAFVPGSKRNKWLRRAGELDVRIGADRTIIEATFHAFDPQLQRVSRVEHVAMGESPAPSVIERPAGWTALPLDVRPFPLVVQYSVSRAVLDIPMRVRDTHAFRPEAALEGALSAEGKTFRHLFEWLREREDIENEAVRYFKQHREDRQLGTVRRAIASALPGFSNLRVRRSPLRMTVQKGPLELRVDQLSDGEKCFLALIGDLARRLATANPWHEDALKASAIVLIDEIELHMHPAWQRDVVDILRKTFPGCQFIVTTHSPQVLAEVPNDSVIHLEDFTAFAKHAGTYQRDSNVILSEAMGAGDRPKAMANRLRYVNKLLDDEKLVEAREEIEKIAKDLGEDDHEVVGLRTALALIEPERADDADDHQGQRAAMSHRSSELRRCRL